MAPAARIPARSSGPLIDIDLSDADSLLAYCMSGTRMMGKNITMELGKKRLCQSY
jgi:hypothetical protein